MAPGKRTSTSQLTPLPLSKRQRADDETAPAIHRHFQDTGIWKEAPVLKGSTKFEPLSDAKNILITGGAGFIACWLVRHLTLTYPDAYNIISFDKLEYCASLNNTRNLGTSPNFTFVHGDITSPTDVQAALRKYKIDTIFHFAAQTHVDLSFGNSYEFTNTNVYGTHVLLECAKNHGMLKRFIHVSTDEVYGEVAEDGNDLDEQSILAPTNPYAASKAAAEMLVHSYWKSFKLPVIIVRSNNIYGPHQFPEKVIPKFTLLLHQDSKLLLHGDGLHTRRYLFAADAADAFDTILHRGVIGAIYNVGSTDEVSNMELCKLLLEHFGHNTKAPEWRLQDWVLYTKDRPFNDRRYAVDATKLKELGWQQKTSFEDGLKVTVEWYRAFGERWWGDVGRVLKGPFPVVREGSVVSESSEDGEGVVKGVDKGCGIEEADGKERSRGFMDKKSGTEDMNEAMGRSNGVVDKSGTEDTKHVNGDITDGIKETNGISRIIERNSVNANAVYT